MVIWICGLSGAGKSSIARELVQTLKSQGKNPVHLDGDEIREIIADPGTGYDRNSRIQNAYRICRLAKSLESQGLIVVVSTMSLFAEIFAWNRRNLVEYYEVFVEAELETLKARDPKGVYRNAQFGESADVPGISLEYDIPQADLKLQNTKPVSSFAPFVLRILEGTRSLLERAC